MRTLRLPRRPPRSAVHWFTMATLAAWPPAFATAQTDTTAPRPPAAVAAASWDREFITSIRDRDGISVEGILGDLEEAELPARRGSRVPVSAAVALATVRKLTTVPLPADSPGDPIVLRAAATVAALANAPLAQAYLLEAERREPGNLATRISLATLLIAQGYPEEALALIGPRPPTGEAAKVRGMNLRAGWYLTRGNGLLCGNKPAESVDPFREAGKEDPFLSESARGEAKAHLMLGNRAGARQAIRRASRQPQHVRWDEDGGQGELPYNKLYDLSRGRHRELVTLEPPERAATALHFLRTVSALQKEVWAAEAAVSAQLQAVGMRKLEEGLRQPTEAEPGTGSTRLNSVASLVALNVLDNVEGVSPPVTTWDHEEPAKWSYRDMLSRWDPQVEATSRRDGALGIKHRETIRTMLQFMDEEPRLYQAFMKKMEHLPSELEPRCQAKKEIVGADLPATNALFYEHDKAVREWFSAAWSIATAIASHAEGGTDQDMAAVGLEADMLAIENFRLFYVALLYTRYSVLEECESVFSGATAAAKRAAAQEMLKCDPFLKGMNLKLKIPDANGSSLFDIKINCEKIQVKGKVVQLIPEVLALKLGVEWTPGSAGGEVTGLVGLSAGAGVITASTDLGVTVNSTGVSDVFIKGSIDGNLPIDAAGDATGQLSVSGKLSGRDIKDIAGGVNVDTVTDLVTGGGVQVIREAVLYWAPGGS